jgi:2-methylfumaryl-CoA hydratase
MQLERRAGLLRVEAEPFDVLAPQVPISVERVRVPEYGHVLEDFVPGTVFVHPRGLTFDRGMMLAYAQTFMEANPLYLNEAFAARQGYPSLPAAPHLVMNVALSLGVQNDSEKAIANLGYYDVRFLRPVYAGDTLFGRTRVVARKDRGVGKPGIVTIETLAHNQVGKVAVQYTRKIFVPRGGAGPIDEAARAEARAEFPYVERPILKIPVPDPQAFAHAGVTTAATLLDSFTPGEVIVHANGRTITDEHVQWTYRVMNTHPLHYDRLYSMSRQGPMSGEPIVYGGLVFAWLLGLASRDVTENAIWDLGYHDGYHTQPAFAGDTIAALTRVLSVEEVSTSDAGPPDAGVVRMQLIGVKNLRAQEALDRYGAELFALESGKKGAGQEKIPEKIFEIERASLIRKHLP